jgi:hypothetical protein
MKPQEAIAIACRLSIAASAPRSCSRRAQNRPRTARLHRTRPAERGIVQGRQVLPDRSRRIIRNRAGLPIGTGHRPLPIGFGLDHARVERRTGRARLTPLPASSSRSLTRRRTHWARRWMSLRGRLFGGGLEARAPIRRPSAPFEPMRPRRRPPTERRRVPRPAPLRSQARQSRPVDTPGPRPYG